MLLLEKRGFLQNGDQNLGHIYQNQDQPQAYN